MARVHQNESGKEATNRGKPPHKHGYHARMKPVNPFKIWFEVDGKRCASDWNPGRRKR